MRLSETVLLASFVEALRSRLPPSWKMPGKLSSLSGRGITLKAPGGESARLAVAICSRLDPREVPGAAAKLNRQSDTVPMIIAPYLGQRTRELLTEEGVGYWDQTGNFRLAIDRPAIFIDVTGADKDPAPDTRPLRSLRGQAAGRAVRALCDFRPPYGTRELASRSGTPAPTLSRVVDLLVREAIVERESKRGRIVRVDWQALLRRWVQDYDFVRSNQTATFLEPRGLTALLEKLRGGSIDYAVTATLAADARGAAVSAPRLATIFVAEVDRAAKALKLRPAESGGNVLLARPYNPVAVERTMERDGIAYAAPSQVAVDLLTGPGRGPADGEALINWMKENEDAWRS